MRICRLTCLILLIFSLGCNSDNPSPEDPPNGGVDINASDIQLNVQENEVLSTELLEIDLPDNIEVSSVRIYIDDELITTLEGGPYQFSLNTSQFEDGNHTLKVEVYVDDQLEASRSISIKIDNNGPVLNLIGIVDGEVICTETEIAPELSDQVSAIEQLQVLLDDELILDTNNTDYSFILNPEEFSAGVKNLKFVMTDTAGNTSRDSIDVGVAKKFTAVFIPEGLTRESEEKVHIILSDSEGNFLSSALYEGGLEKTLSVCSTKPFDNGEEFILTFIDQYRNYIYEIYSYSNVTKEMVGDEITLKPRNFLSRNLVEKEIEVPFYQKGYYMASTGPNSNLGYNFENITGWVDTDFTSDLSSNKTLFYYYHPGIPYSYKWALYEDFHLVSSIREEDFTSNQVVEGNFSLIGSQEIPYFYMWGYESENHLIANRGHIFMNGQLLFETDKRKYYYPDIFDYTSYLGYVSNYYWAGVGVPPSTIEVPNASVDFGYSSENVFFSGVSGFNVGRILLDYADPSGGPLISASFIFDGNQSEVFIPKIPEGLINADFIDVFNNQRMNFRQGAAENYSGFSDYKEYIPHVLVPSLPYYSTSPFVERVFKNLDGHPWIDIYAREFPF